MFRKKKVEEPVAPHEMGPPVEFKAKGGSKQENQQNLIQVRQSPGIVVAKQVMANAITRRAERVLLDYSQQAVAVQMDVDGLWQQAPPLDRQNGDMMLAVMKKLANLNERERRQRQVGNFGASLGETKLDVEIVSQGTQTGERVLLKLAPPEAKFSNLTDLGFREAQLEQFRKLVGRAMTNEDVPVTKGLIIFSAPPNGGGLSTLYSCAMRETDRYMRDFVGIEEVSDREPEVENIEVLTYDAGKGESPDQMFRSLLLKQPEVFVVPNVPNPETMKLLCEQVVEEDRMAFTNVRAKDASEALLRAYMLKAPKELFAESVTLVLNMRLIRKLCDHCKQPYPPNPQLLQKLGIPAGRVAVLYREYQPPPPGQEPEGKKGEEPVICPKCNGNGYFGRTGLFEMLVVDDRIRQALLTQPRLETIRRLAKQAGSRTIQEEGILMVAKVKHRFRSYNGF